MIRRLQTILHKNVDATFTASVAMVRGMLVQKDLATKTVVLPTSNEGLYFVTKESVPTGIMTAEGELSDYDPRYEAISAGEKVKLEKPISGEKYAVDQFVDSEVDALEEGDYLTVVTSGANQGKIVKSETATNFAYGGTYNDNGKTLAIVQVL